MTEKKVSLFPRKDLEELGGLLSRLRRVCCPASEIIAPSIKFKRASEFNNLDVLEYGVGGYTIKPSELKDLWQDRRTLRDHSVDFIVVNGVKWFYKNSSLNGNFFSVDGQKKVEINFSFWMDAESIFKIPEAMKSVRKLLGLCSGEEFPDLAKAYSCFPENTCRLIYKKNPSREAVEQAVLEMMEAINLKTCDYLEKNHQDDIINTRGFKRFVKKRNMGANQ